MDCLIDCEDDHDLNEKCVIALKKIFRSGETESEDINNIFALEYLELLSVSEDDPQITAALELVKCYYMTDDV